jgi:uncharacterized membrane protein YkoI
MCVNRAAKVLIPLVLAGALIPAFGHGSADPATQPGAPQFSESEKATVRQEIKVFADARISARRAITIAEKRGAGAKVVDLSFDGTTLRMAYRVKVLLNEALWEGVIDASTGVPIGEGSTTPVSNLGEENKTALAAFSAAGVDLSEAIAIAEEYVSGKAVSAGLQDDGANLVLLVVVVSEGELKEISVEPEGRAPAQGVRPRKEIGAISVRKIARGVDLNGVPMPSRRGGQPFASSVWPSSTCVRQNLREGCHTGPLALVMSAQPASCHGCRAQRGRRARPAFPLAQHLQHRHRPPPDQSIGSSPLRAPTA